MTVPTDSPRGIANMPEAAKSPTVDLDGLKTLLRFPDPDTEKAESAIDAASADASAKKSLGEALYRELERGGFSPESGPKEVCLASALVRLHDGPNTKIDATFSDALYSRYTALKAPYVAETVAESTGAKELLDVAVRKIVERGVGHLSSPEGIQFGIDHLHAEVVGTLAEIDAGLPPEHPLKGLSTPLIENFLIPPENGKRLIRYSVNRLFPNEH
ncbi:MAG TPA: hypothetical protein PK765_07785, partial [bacterium]|nr:hypothetical protein [bacterium]